MQVTPLLLKAKPLAPQGVSAAAPNPTGETPPAVNLSQDSIDRFTSEAAQNTPVGNRAILAVAGHDPITVEGQKAAFLPTALSDSKQVVTAVARELSMAAQAGPNLAITAASLALKPLVLQGVPSDVGAYVNQWYTPAVRALSAAYSVQAFVRGWQEGHSANPEENLPKTPLDGVNQVVEAAHVLTATAGFAGSVASAVDPALGNLGSIGMAVAVAGDVAEFSVNEMRYILLRDKVTPGQIDQDSNNPL
jgi:hypothetical protein